MKHLSKVILLLLVVVITACKKEDTEPSARELVEGKWTIVSTEVLATVIAGDGSYLRFDPCGTTCSGVDYMSSDTTSGVFTYFINEEATKISITYNSGDGGNWNGEWDILELTTNDFRMTSSTILGSMKVEMKK